MPLKTKKKRGRPRKSDSEKRRNNVTIRMRDDLKRRIEESANSHGRSLSEEIEFSLERRFLEEAAYGGKELNGLLMLMVGAAEIIQARSKKSWWSDWDTSMAVQEAWKQLAAAAGPIAPAKSVQDADKSSEPSLIPDWTTMFQSFDLQKLQREYPEGSTQRESLKTMERMRKNWETGGSVAAELSPNRKAVTETGNPSQVFDFIRRN